MLARASVKHKQHHLSRRDIVAKKVAKAVSEAAAALSKLGASKGGKARAEALSAADRKKIAQKAARARWRKKKA